MTLRRIKHFFISSELFNTFVSLLKEAPVYTHFNKQQTLQRYEAWIYQVRWWNRQMCTEQHNDTAKTSQGRETIRNAKHGIPQSTAVAQQTSPPVLPIF